MQKLERGKAWERGQVYFQKPFRKHARAALLETFPTPEFECRLRAPVDDCLHNLQQVIVLAGFSQPYLEKQGLSFARTLDRWSRLLHQSGLVLRSQTLTRKKCLRAAQD